MDIDAAVRKAHWSGYRQGRRSARRIGVSNAVTPQNTICSMAADVVAAQEMWKAHVDGAMRSASQFSDLAAKLIGLEHPLANWLADEAVAKIAPQLAEREGFEPSIR